MTQKWGGAFERTEAAGDFLFDFEHPDALFAGVVCEGHGGVADEPQDGIGMLAQQVEGDRLLGASTLVWWLEHFRIELFSVVQYAIVERAEGGDVGGAQHHAFAPDRFAQRVGLTPKFGGCK